MTQYVLPPTLIHKFLILPHLDKWDLRSAVHTALTSETTYAAWKQFSLPLLVDRWRRICFGVLFTMAMSTETIMQISMHESVRQEATKWMQMVLDAANVEATVLQVVAEAARIEWCCASLAQALDRDQFRRVKSLRIPGRSVVSAPKGTSIITTFADAPLSLEELARQVAPNQWFSLGTSPITTNVLRSAASYWGAQMEDAPFYLRACAIPPKWNVRHDVLMTMHMHIFFDPYYGNANTPPRVIGTDRWLHTWLPLTAEYTTRFREYVFGQGLAGVIGEQVGRTGQLRNERGTIVGYVTMIRAAGYIYIRWTPAALQAVGPGISTRHALLFAIIVGHAYPVERGRPTQELAWTNKGWSAWL